MNYFFFIYGLAAFLSISLAAMNPDQPNADAERQVFTLTIFADDYFDHTKQKRTGNSTCGNIPGLQNAEDTSHFIPNQKTDDTQTADTLPLDDNDDFALIESGPNEARTGHGQQYQPDSTDVGAPITIPQPTEASASPTLSPLATLLTSASSRSTINRNNFYDEPVTRKQPHCSKRKSWSEGFHAPADFIPPQYRTTAALSANGDNLMIAPSAQQAMPELSSSTANSSINFDPLHAQCLAAAMQKVKQSITNQKPPAQNNEVGCPVQ